MAKKAHRDPHEEQYLLRSIFYYKRRSQFKEWLDEVKAVSRGKYDWRRRRKLGISDTAWRSVKAKRLSPSMVFCHPSIIRLNPHLIGYYRCMAAMPQKGTGRLAFSTAVLEISEGRSLTEKKAGILSALFNTHISSIIESEPDFHFEDLLMTAMMNYGSQINGSWRGDVGEKGAARFKTLLLDFLGATKAVAEATSKRGTKLDWPLARSDVPKTQRVVLKNNYEVVFGSEPDVSVLDGTKTLQAALEIKSGLDPAGALERYGAAKKSFDKALKSNKSAETIYLSSCITPAVSEEMKTDRLVRREFDLMKIFVSAKHRKKFLAHMKWLLRL
jgi:hypothetical protein